MTRNKNKHRTVDKQMSNTVAEGNMLCIHIEKCITPTKVKTSLPHSVFGRCCECTNKDTIQVCVKCGKQFCRPHSDIHSKKINHALTYDLTTFSIHCNICKKNIPYNTHSAVTMVLDFIEGYLKKQIKAEECVAPKIVISSPTKDCKPEVLEPNRNTVIKVPHVIEPQIKGLKNTGVICFFNSVLQNLIQTPMLRASLCRVLEGYTDVLHTKLYGDMDITVGSGNQSNAMMQKYRNFLQMQDSKEKNRALYPHEVFQEMCIYNECLSYGQQDAQEAFHSILHSMNSEEGRSRKNAVLEKLEYNKSSIKGMTKEKRKKVQEFSNLARNETFIDMLFRGSTLTHITCLTCHYVTTIKDHFIDLSVPLPKKEDTKARRKQKSSGEQGISKHQKKKQAKENRKKGKKNQKDKKEDVQENGGQQNGDCDEQHVKENGLDVVYVKMGDIELQSRVTEGNVVAVEDVTIEMEKAPEHIMETVELVNEEQTDQRSLDEKLAELAAEINEKPCLRGVMHKHVKENDIEDEEVRKEDIKFQFRVTEGNSAAVEDVTIEMEKAPEAIMETVELLNEEQTDQSSLDEKLAELAAEINEKPCLRGGVQLDPEEIFNGEEDGDMLCNLFQQDDENLAASSLAPTCSSATGTELSFLFEDLEIDTSNIGDDSLDACFVQFCKEELLTDQNQFMCINCAKQSVDMRDSLNVSMAKYGNSSFSDEDELCSEDDNEQEEKLKPIARDARVRTILNHLPPILVIHLKRFTQEPNGRLQKDRRNIHYSVDLNLDNFMSSKDNVGNKYKLYGVVEHSGSLHRGHYIAFVRKRNTKLDEHFLNDSIPLHCHIKLLGQLNSEIPGPSLDKWYCCNDERISEVPVKKVLNADAYLLFYERCLPYS